MVPQASAESKLDASEQANIRFKAQVDDMARQLNDLTSLKARLTQENFDLQHQVISRSLPSKYNPHLHTQSINEILIHEYL